LRPEVVRREALPSTVGRNRPDPGSTFRRIREWLSDRITPYWTFPLLTAVQGLMVVIGIILVMAYYTLAERKIIGWIQARKGPNRVNLLWIPGAGQPFADVFKLLFKEILIPADASGFLFRLAPFLSMIPAIAIWAVIPLSPERAFANIDAGLLYVLALTSMGVYGIILAGWAANSKYAFLGAMRSAAQIVAYEIAMGFAMVGVLMAAGSLNIGDIIQAQHGGPLSWNWFWLFPLMMVYFISGVAETNRAPFDVAEGESEIVAGFHVDYSGMAFALFFIAEYVNMILISALTVVFFLGGWLSPFDGYLPEDAWLATPSFFWFGLKTLFPMFSFLWLRATFPRYRYDQIMRLGWKALIPVTLVWLLVEGFMVYFHVGPWKGHP
jgi:NADH-quinone oxidoreductase subunit H